jgi:hypothetical protein
MQSYILAHGLADNFSTEEKVRRRGRSRRTAVQFRGTESTEGAAHQRESLCIEARPLHDGLGLNAK